MRRGIKGDYKQNKRGLLCSVAYLADFSRLCWLIKPNTMRIKNSLFTRKAAIIVLIVNITAYLCLIIIIRQLPLVLDLPLSPSPPRLSHEYHSLCYDSGCSFKDFHHFVSRSQFLLFSLSGAAQKRIIKSSKLNLSGPVLWNPVKPFGNTEY